MPSYLRKSKLSDALAFFKSRAILASLICALAVFGLWLWHNKSQVAHFIPVGATSTPVGVSPTPVPSCAAPDQSFCQTQAEVVGYVKTGDSSDILELQAPISVIQNAVPVQVFELDQGTSITRLTRNNYINYFRSYWDQFGPFLYQDDTRVGSTITMNFLSSRTAKTYKLSFQLVNNDWQLQRVMVE